MVTINVNEDLQLRSYRPEDATELFSVVNASRVHLGAWLPWVPLTTKVEHSLRFIQDSAQEAKNQQALALGIFYRGKLVGGVGMHNWDHHVKRAHVGYWIAKEYEGEGIISRSLQHFAHFLFEKAGLNKIEIHFSVANIRSAKVAEKLGCKIEGVIRHSALRNGKYEDMVVTGLLRDEWKGL